MQRVTILAGLLLAAAGCDEAPAPTVTDIQTAAKERVRQALGLKQDATFFATTFVGETAEGRKVLCGRVEGQNAAGNRVTPRRFIAALEGSEWIVFEPATSPSVPSRPDIFIEWHTACAGQRVA